MSERAQGAGGGAQIVLSQETPSAPRALRPAPSLLRELAVAAFYVALTLYFTWPLAARLTTAVSDEGDPLLNAWILDWDCYALAHQPLHLFDAPIFVPGHLPLAYSENLLGVAIPLFPAWLPRARAITPARPRPAPRLRAQRVRRVRAGARRHRQYRGLDGRGDLLRVRVVPHLPHAARADRLRRMAAVDPGGAHRLPPQSDAP